MAPSVSPAVDFSELPWGTHLCHFYATPQDLLDTLEPFFKAGLEKHVGIDAEAVAKPQALGLLGMRERAAFVNGHVEISGRPGKGTVLIVRIPARNSHGEDSDHR